MLNEIVQQNASKCAVFYIKGVGVSKSWSTSTLKKPAMGFLLHKIQHILMHLGGPFLWAQTSLNLKSDQKVTEEANQEEKTVCSQAKDKPWMMSTGLVWPCQRTFHIKMYLIFICYFKKTGKKSNTQKKSNENYA